MGRTGYQESGMSVSGVMDQRSAALANILVGNDENEGVMEVTLMGPMSEFTADNIIAVTGANLGAKLNGKELPMYQAVQVHKGRFLKLCRHVQRQQSLCGICRRAGYPGHHGKQVHKPEIQGRRL